MNREEAIQELGEWLVQMIQHGVPSHSAKRKALATAIALLSADRPSGDLISRADAVKAMCGKGLFIRLKDAIGAINEVPSVSADRPSGEWEHWGSPFSEDDIINTMVCTNCGMRFVEIKGETFYYCPNCGARMKGGDDE